MSLVGLYIEGTGFLFVAALVGAWALGRRLRPHAARVLGSVVLAAAVANAVMCWTQMSSAFSSGMFDRVDGRAPGLLGNPVHATAFLVGAFALAVERARDPSRHAFESIRLSRRVRAVREWRAAEWRADRTRAARSRGAAGVGALRLADDRDRGGARRRRAS